VDSSPDARFRFQPLFSYAFKNALNEDSSKDEMEKFFADIFSSTDDFLLQTDKRRSEIYPVFRKNATVSHLAFKENGNQYVIPRMMQFVEPLKLLGVVRHPCGALNSWIRNQKEFPSGADPRKEWRFGGCKNEGKAENFFGYYKWKEVANLYLDLRDKYPGRVYIARYDEVVDDPFTQVKQIFDFLSLDYTDQTNTFLKDSQEKHQENPYSVFKNRCVKDKWKFELDPYISSEVLYDLAGTRLEMFIR